MGIHGPPQQPQVAAHVLSILVGLDVLPAEEAVQNHEVRVLQSMLSQAGQRPRMIHELLPGAVSIGPGRINVFEDVG